MVILCAPIRFTESGAAQTFSPTAPPTAAARGRGGSGSPRTTTIVASFLRLGLPGVRRYVVPVVNHVLLPPGPNIRRGVRVDPRLRKEATILPPLEEFVDPFLCDASGDPSYPHLITSDKGVQVAWSWGNVVIPTRGVLVID